MQNDKSKFKKQFIDRLILFSISIIELTNRLPKNPKFWPIRDQIIRSSTSIGANVVEAKSSSSRRDYIKFFEIALKSANETEYWLMLIKKLGIDCKSNLKENNEIASIIASSILTLKNKS
jgi:four helix bundle protein